MSRLANHKATAPERVRLVSLGLAATLTIPTQYWVSRSWAGFSIMSLFIQAVFVTFAVARALGATTKVSTGTISTRRVRGFVWTGLVSKCIFEE